MKLVIILRGLHRTTHPQTVSEFRHSARLDAYLYEGREFSASEFNEFSRGKEWERLIDRYGARIRVETHSSNMAKAREALLRKQEAKATATA